MLALVSMAAAVAVAVAADDLCYAVKVQGAEGVKKFTLKPITGFPAGHILTTNQVCGNKFNAGDPIPHDVGSGWSMSGQSSATASTCKKTTSGGLFYAYNYPNGASSNVGFEQDKAMTVYFTVDDAGELSLVMNFDRPNNGNGGEVMMSINAPDLRGVDVNFALRDDGHEPTVGRSGTRAMWNSATGVLENMYWRWVGCCTDGVVIGRLPESGFTLPFSFSELPGLDTFKMGSWNSETNGVEFTEIDTATILAGGVTVEASTCGAYCGAKTSCGACSLDDDCGWCGETGKCVLASEAASCPAEFNAGAANCDTCAVATSCGDCTGAAGCSWDHGASECISASGDALFRNVTFLSRLSTECSVCPGTGYDAATGKRSSWCSGHGTCDWAEKTCGCDEGFGGVDCGTACPVGADGKVCGGHGECGADGTCSCACGFKGDTCEGEGCPCREGALDAAFCYIGDCEVKCGVKLGGTCTGSQDPATEAPSCACAAGWWGDDCTKTCPGVKYTDGTGAICGGHGTCGDNGTCTCTGCRASNSEGICAPTAPLVCENHGWSICTEATGFAQSCDCGEGSMWKGPTCGACSCPGSVACNAISGKCDYGVCDRKTQYQVSVGDTDSDTVCGNATACNSATHYTSVGLSTYADRECEPYAPPCTAVEYEDAALTATSNRVCLPVTVCGVAFGTYQVRAATATLDAICMPLNTGNLKLGGGGTSTGSGDTSSNGGGSAPCVDNMYESVAPTLTSDRTCTEQPVCTNLQYEQAPAASVNTSRTCASLTSCTEGKQYETVAATATSNRECVDYTPECVDSDDMVETTAATATSDRVCSKSDDCASNPCENRGTCNDGVLSFTCTCTASTAGDKCQYFNSCYDNPCQNGGACEATEVGAMCNCDGTGGAGACCADGDPVSEQDGGICVDIATAQGSMLGENGEPDADASSSTVTIAAAVAGVLVVLFVAGITIRRKKAAREERDLQEEMDTLLDNSKFLAAIGGGGAGKGKRASATEYASIAEMRAAGGRGGALDTDANYTEAGRGEDVYSSANVLDGVGEAVYSQGNAAAGEAVYAQGDSAAGEAVYSQGNAAAGEAVYAQGNAAAGEAVYAQGDSAAGEAVYAQGDAAAGEAVYSAGNDGGLDMYRAEAEYAVGNSSSNLLEQATYDTGNATVEEPTYMAADHQDDEELYLSATHEAEDSGDTYALADPDNAKSKVTLRSSSYKKSVTVIEDTYDIGSAAEGATYDIGSAVPADVDAGIQEMEDMYGAGGLPGDGFVRTDSKFDFKLGASIEPEVASRDKTTEYLKVLDATY